MTREEAIKYLRQIYPNGGHCWLDSQRIEAIDMAIMALSQPSLPSNLDEAAEEKSSQNFHAVLMGFVAFIMENEGIDLTNEAEKEAYEFWKDRLLNAAAKEYVKQEQPRWKRAAASFGNYSVAPTETGALCLLIDGHYIMLSDLEKLPGFKED